MLGLRKIVDIFADSQKFKISFLFMKKETR